MKISSQRVLLLRLSIGTGLWFAAQTQAETWSFDPSFQRTPLRVTSETAYAVKVLRSGKVLTYSINGGLLSGANGQRIGALVRIDPNTGAIDPTWNPDPTLTGVGFAGVAEAPDGKIYYATALIGDLANGSDPAVNRLIRLNTDGSRDTSFNSPIFAIGVRFLGVQPDGKIIACSGGLNLSGVPPAGSIVQTVRLNTDGTLDNGFQSPNFQVSATDPPASVASGNYYDAGVFGNPVIDSTTGKIYFCGTFKFVNGQPRKSIVRCNADGTLDSSFVPTGLIGGSTTLQARAMVLQAGGKVILGGRFLRTAAGGSTQYALLRFNTDGTLDSTFTRVPTTNPSGIALVPGYFGPRDIHTLPGGNILTSGERVLRFLPDGTLDSTFTPLDYSSPFFTPNNGVIAAFRFDLDPNTGAAYLPNPGPLYARLGGVPVPGEITKLTPGGTIDNQFSSPVVESEDFAPNVQISANGAVYVSGNHTAFGNAANATITRLLANGTRDATYSLDTLPFADKQAAGFALLPDSSAYVIYSSGSFTGAYSFSNLARLLPTGALDTSFRLSSALQTAFSINAFDGNDTAKSALAEISSAPGGRLYFFGSGAQATVNTNGNLKLTRINADGTEDPGVPALGFPVGEVTRDGSGNLTGGSTGYLNRLAQTADGGFLVLVSVAPFPTSTGNPYNYQVIKLRADGSRDSAFGPLSITSTAPAVLDFPLIFDPVKGITTQLLNGIYAAPEFPVSKAAMFPDGSFILGGKFRVNGGSTDYSVAKFTAAGAFALFNPPVPGAENRAQPSRPPRVTKVRVAPDGKIWVLGRFDTIGGNQAPGVARLNPDGSLDNTFALTQVGYYDSFGDAADVVFANNSTAYLVGTFRLPGEPLPFAITRILKLPVITSPLSAAANVGQQFTYQLLATDATLLGASNLPAGLTFTASLGAITGTPTAAGTFSVGLSASNAAGGTNATLTITVQPAPPAGPVITSSTSATGRVGQPFSFQVITTGGSPASRVSATGLPPGLVIDAVTGLISGTPTAGGSSAVTLTITDGNQTTTNVLQLSFTADPTIPVIISSSSASLTPGQAFTYKIVAPATSDPSDVTIFTLIGKLPTGLFFDPKTGVISGTFMGNPDRIGPPDWKDLSGGIVTNVQIFATNSHGTSTIPLNFFLAPTGAVNIATRLAVGTGNNVLIAGFIITGNAPKKVIIRAIGPSLPLPGALQDPTLELHDGTSLLGKNDNWRDSQENEIIATTIPPSDNRESAIVATLTPGSYTAIVAGSGDTTGIAVVELYDLGTASLDNSSKAQLAQISTRGTVLGGDNVMIGGFIISGSPTKVIVRAIGPSLTAFGVDNALQDTVLELHDSSGTTILSNDDWRSTQEQEIIATTVPPKDDRESAIVATLSPGAYTGIVRGKGSATGVALVEVYGLQ
jgi:uncharacterized delta-60 repeat protein